MTEHRKHTVLVVDDEKEITSSLVALFRRSYNVLAANSAPEALERLGTCEVHVLMTDQRMPGTTGTVFLEQVAGRYPDTVRILLTGYADVQAAIDAINKGQVYRYLTKPWNPEELMSVVRQAAQRFDLTRERRELIADLKKANKELREIDRLRAAFIEVVGHELKTPLTVLLGYTHLLETGCYGELPGPSRPALGNLSRTLAHLNDIVMRTLKLLKADLRDGTMLWSDFPLDQLIEDAHTAVGVFLELRCQTLRVRSEVPGVLITADRYKLLDVMVNLLTNAIKFSQDGNDIDIEVEPSADGFVRVSVIDTGVGIAPDDLPRVFDRFFASYDTGHHSSGAYQFGRRGVGLGLAIVKRFVDLHGGQLELQTEPGMGTRVSFTVKKSDATELSSE